ncbi:transmembrane protein 205 [Anguilla rostrata]|uniref:transmembrane protein 205 n=1 Tax=Anguilla anguilla TaxID=7936 RepID=UPI0015AA6C5C|nr:transmembrane protein 205 [Anguilla anguilla]XP_035271852.1 transmembrane protein 205 [Anguilla anguilla]
MNNLEEPILKLLHLALLSTFWGMQFWYIFFTTFVMGYALNRHTHGYIQSRLLPFYHRIASACAFFSLILFELYHPHHQMSDKETFQIFILFACVMAATLNSHYFGAMTWEIMADMHLIEQSWGMSKNIWLSASSEAYDKLSQSNSEYKRLSYQLWFYHWLSSLCNLCCLICNSCSMYYLAQNFCAL